jgi:hypothetical protein
MLDITTEDDDQIVALYIKGEIYLGEGAIAKAKEVGTVDRIIPRSFFKFLKHFDDNIKWREYSGYLTLFTISEYNEFITLHHGKPISTMF